MRTGTLSDYAAHLGVSNAYITKLRKQGRLVMVEAGGKQLVNFDASDRLIRNTADLGRAGNGRNAGGGSALMGDLDRAVPMDAPASGAKFDVLFRKAQTQERVYVAKLAQLKWEEESGDLIRVADVRATLAHVVATTREALLQLPARMAPLLAAESDTAAVQNLLHAEIHAALDTLAKSPDTVGTARAVPATTEGAAP